MKELGSDEPDAVRRHGAVDLPTIQRYMNFWFTSSLDLFGSEVSSNAASSFANGIKGRPDETQYQDHICNKASYELETPQGKETVSLRNAMNEVLRNAYIKDCEIGVKRWNMQISRAGFDFQLRLPSPRFRRAIGVWANAPTDPQGKAISREDFARNMMGWIPSEGDRAFVLSLMQRVVEPGKMAGWIAPPDRGINNLPVDYEYVKLKLRADRDQVRWTQLVVALPDFFPESAGLTRLPAQFGARALPPHPAVRSER
jgi:benzoyl-CoA 2,3-dioxygenase component B